MASETEETEALIDIEEMVDSLTGFDQIAIRQRFNERFDSLAEDPIMLTRGIYFVQLRRDGEKDADAFNQAMTIPFGELQGKFTQSEDAVDPEDESAIVERDREFAEFVMATGLSYTVEQYMSLTLSQRNAVYDVAAKTRR